MFHSKENCLYSAGVDFLKVYGWEPSRCFDSVAVGWGRPADIAAVDTQLVSQISDQYIHRITPTNFY